MMGMLLKTWINKIRRHDGTRQISPKKKFYLKSIFQKNSAVGLHLVSPSIYSDITPRSWLLAGYSNQKNTSFVF